MGREFTVKARIVADTKDAERNLRATADATKLLETKLTDLRAKFDSGGISADKFVRQQANMERQLRNISGAMEEAKGSVGSFSSFLSDHLVVTLGEVANAAREAFATVSEEAKRSTQENILRKQIEDYDAFIAKIMEQP